MKYELSHPELLALIFRDSEELTWVSEQRTFQGPDLHPVLIPRDLGLLLESAGDKELFIEVFPTHAQIWRRCDWDKSSERRIRACQNQERRNVEREITNELISKVAAKLAEVTGLPPEKCIQGAARMIKERQKYLLASLGFELF